MRVQELINYGIKELRKNEIEDEIIKSKILLSYILGIDKNKLIIYGQKYVENEIKERYIQGINKIVNGMPLQYITNKQEFMGLDFYVNENVLIPQPDTEILVEETIKIAKDKMKILDLCTGSGAIAISIGKYLQNISKKEISTKVHATDISERALNIAKKNAKLNNVKVEFFLSDMFNALEKKYYDIIVSNPPYIEKNTIESLPKDVQNQPKLALDGGKDGLEFYRIIAKKGKEYLKPKRISFAGNRI